MFKRKTPFSFYVVSPLYGQGMTIAEGWHFYKCQHWHCFLDHSRLLFGETHHDGVKWGPLQCGVVGRGQDVGPGQNSTFTMCVLCKSPHRTCVLKTERESELDDGDSGLNLFLVCIWSIIWPIEVFFIFISITILLNENFLFDSLLHLPLLPPALLCVFYE